MMEQEKFKKNKTKEGKKRNRMSRRKSVEFLLLSLEFSAPINVHKFV
jgi:hypothetical protein